MLNLVKRKTLSTSLLFGLILINYFPAKAALGWKNDIESLINLVIIGASNTIGKASQAKPVKWGWCDDTYYSPNNNFICLEKEFIKQLSEIGDAAVAFVAAHEYAHHVQYAKPSLMLRAQGNTMRQELQADCFAGVILSSIPTISFDKEDVKHMVLAAALLGDREFDSPDHHGGGENRALALRSGLRFGGTKGKVKDAYYKMFCMQK